VQETECIALRHTVRLAGSKRSDVMSAHSMDHITLQVLAGGFFFKEIE
jgi:hypothetical protein